MLTSQLESVCAAEVASTDDRLELVGIYRSLPYGHEGVAEGKLRGIYNELFLQAESFEEISTLQEEASSQWEVPDRVARHLISLTSSSDEIRSLRSWMPDSVWAAFNEKWAEHSVREITSASTREEAWVALRNAPSSVESQGLAKVSSFY